MFTKMSEFVGWWSREVETSRKVIGALPDKGLKHRPHKKSRTGAELVWHIVTGPRWFAGEVFKLPIEDGFNKRFPKAPAKTADALAAFDLTFATCKAAIQSKDDAWLAQPSDFVGQMMPNGVILAIMLFHDTHHRGQLSVYLREVGAKVPSIYGPSADEDREGKPVPKKKNS